MFSKMLLERGIQNRPAVAQCLKYPGSLFLDGILNRAVLKSVGKKPSWRESFTMLSVSSDTELKIVLKRGVGTGSGERVEDFRSVTGSLCVSASTRSERFDFKSHCTWNMGKSAVCVFFAGRYTRFNVEYFLPEVASSHLDPGCSIPVAAHQ